MSRCARISGNSTTTSIQLSIKLAHKLVKISSDCVTSLKRVKSETTGPYIELLSCVLASPTDANGMSCLRECAPDNIIVMPHAVAVPITSLPPSKDVYAPDSKRVSAVKKVVDWCMDIKH